MSGAKAALSALGPAEPGSAATVEHWLSAYRTQAARGDALIAGLETAPDAWRAVLDALAALSGGRLDQLRERVAAQALEIGMAFRTLGDSEERSWPLEPLPLLLDEAEWAAIEAGVRQRAELFERILADAYGPQQLVRTGVLPPTLFTGSPSYWRQMIGVPPPGGHYLRIYGVDLCRDPSGGWRVLADHARAPSGAGYALENRLVLSRMTGALFTRLNVARLAPFFAALKQGLAAACRRTDPRIGLLTPGRYSQSYAEQAHLARYLGLLLVEGDDLTVRDDLLYVRTIEGLKRVDALWRRIDTRFLDPLAFDIRSQIGVPGIFDAFSAGNVVLANPPGAGLVETPAFAAFLPGLARKLLGEPLTLPSVATWWGGQPSALEEVMDAFDLLAIAPAFGRRTAGLDDGRAMVGSALPPERRRMVLDGMRHRPQDYVGQEVLRLSTAPAVTDGSFEPRPFTVRVFATRDADRVWRVMPGGFVRLGDEADARADFLGANGSSADLCITGRKSVTPITLLPNREAVSIRRIPGTLPSRAADDLFWLGRYLERAEMTLRITRATLGSNLDAEGGAGLARATLARLCEVLTDWGAASDDPEEPTLSVRQLCRSALDEAEEAASVRTLLVRCRGIAQGMRDRLSLDFWRLIERAIPPLVSDEVNMLLDHAKMLQDLFSALAGLAAENMGRTAGWRFHDLGRRIERAINVCQLVQIFGDADALADDLNVLLDVCDSQILYRSRYLVGVTLAPVRDLVALDPFNPRSIAFQAERTLEHLRSLPSLRNDGMPEEPPLLATALEARLLTAEAGQLGQEEMAGIERQLLDLSDAIGRRYFLQEGDVPRAAGMTRLA